MYQSEVMLLLCHLHRMHNLMNQLLSVLEGWSRAKQCIRIQSAIVEDASCNMIWSLFPPLLVVVGICCENTQLQVVVVGHLRLKNVHV